jgi:hypothetical protein
MNVALVLVMSLWKADVVKLIFEAAQKQAA